ncbi:MAG: GNAT family N-acetyltransferase [SAR324 cluster bacterium]|nr:GNAT family N-acetyltransferase [SAR324 cluster bacterium]MBL7035329.1 GNAT family N-acetyltransferase [SAR324 cluster bacterium]
MQIREAEEQDFDQIWTIFRQIVSAGESYAYPQETSKEEAFEIWMKQTQKTFVCLENEDILATYYIKQNQPGAGSHVCNCGYMVAAESRGRGLATLMCEHSQDTAQKLGYKAMQFNLVLVSNEQAVQLWDNLGFKTVGRIPKAFKHPKLDFVDALIMYKWF